MNYYLLEDNLIQQDRIQSILKSCHIFDQPAALLAALQADTAPKIILLDLEIRTVANAGLNVAKMIRQFDILSPIIIVTTHSEMATMSYQYQIGALDFIDKTQNEQQFKQRLTSAIAVAEQRIQTQDVAQAEMISLPNGQKSEQIMLNDIRYVTCNDSKSHLITVYCTHKSVQVRSTVKLLPTLHEDLIQIHAAYVINKRHLVSVDTAARTVQLTDQMRVPYSRKYFKMIRDLVS